MIATHTILTFLTQLSKQFSKHVERGPSSPCLHNPRFYSVTLSVDARPGIKNGAGESRAEFLVHGRNRSGRLGGLVNDLKRGFGYPNSRHFRQLPLSLDHFTKIRPPTKTHFSATFFIIHRLHKNTVHQPRNLMH
jgi:hypothetical protein